MEVTVTVADPVAMEGDAILRPVGEGMEGITPLSRRIGLEAGEEVTRRLRDMGEAPVGAALVTPGGALPTPFLIHLVIRSPEEPVAPAGVARALRNGLRQAAGWELEHLILPPLGLGAGNLPAETSARITLEVLKEHAGESPHPARVTIPVAAGYEEEVFRRERDRVLAPEGP